MGSISLESVQKLLHLDVLYPYFQTYEEVLKFEVDGISVRAIARHAWRRESVRVIEPFEVEGSVYQQGYEPPFFALGFSMLKHKEWLANKGMTLTDESIRMATVTYQRHAAYLSNKTRIDAQQDEFMSEFRDDLSSLKAADDEIQSRIALERTVLRKQFRWGQSSQKDYQNSLKKLKSESWDSGHPYSELKRKVETTLESIKQSFIDRVLANTKE